MDLEGEDGSGESRVNFIPCLAWVKRGVAKANPDKVQLTKEELVQIINDTKSKLKVAEDEEEGESSAQTTNPVIDDDEKEFNMENYDEEDESTGLQQLGIQSIAELPTEAEENFSDDDSDKEDDLIKPGDNLILAGKVDGDCSILEIYIHNESEGSLYCHHDLILPAFPLCVEWLDFEPGHAPGNYCAIGSMSPLIDIWDLDIVNCLEPAYTLGSLGSRKKGIKAMGHKDAVLDLAWNSNYHHVMASGSVDQTILLWDIDTGKPSSKIKAFKEKVQTLKWHRLESYTLLAGGCDKTARIFDCRNLDQHQTWQLLGEAERVIWSPSEPFVFYVATNSGHIQCFDCRKGNIWSIQAHEKDITGLSISEQCPGLLLTTSEDGVLKVWDATGEAEPVLVHENDMKIGTAHCLELCPDSPFFVAAGGDNKSKNFNVFDLMNIDVVKHHFGSRPLVKLVVDTTTPEATAMNEEPMED